jgi:hypothetical protein
MRASVDCPVFTIDPKCCPFSPRLQLQKKMARIYYAYVLSLKENRIPNRVRETQLTQWTMDGIHRTPNRCQVTIGAEGLLSSDTTGDHRSSQDSHLRHWAPRSTNHRIEPRSHESVIGTTLTSISSLFDRESERFLSTQ